MPLAEFSHLLSQYMRRIRASANGVGQEIGLSRETVNNWRNGDALPGRRARGKVLACARYLRLTEDETNRLLAAADFEPEFPAESAPPGRAAPGEADPLVGRLLDRLLSLRPYPVLMLLCPAHLGQPPRREAILAAAAQRFGPGRVLHLQPPYSLSSEPGEYFAALAAQGGLQGVDSDFGFESALAARLQEGRPLFCLVSRFEQGDPGQREVLAGILRSLSEMHSGQLHLLICGGAALADLKYAGGDLSLLNIAIAERWPDPQSSDLAAREDCRALDEAARLRALQASGGHPLLLERALDALRRSPRLGDAALVDLLASDDALLQGIAPLLADPGIHAQLSRLLDVQSLCPARPWLADPLLRALYWANLVVERECDGGRWLVWRCAALREAVRRLLQDDAG